MENKVKLKKKKKFLIAKFLRCRDYTFRVVYPLSWNIIEKCR